MLQLQQEEELEVWGVLQTNACEPNRETSRRKKWRKLEKASREKANEKKKKDKKKTGKKNIFIEAKQLAAQLYVWVAWPFG